MRAGGGEYDRAAATALVVAGHPTPRPPGATLPLQGRVNDDPAMTLKRCG